MLIKCSHTIPNTLDNDGKHEARIKLVIGRQSETGFLLSHMDVCPSTYTWKNIVRETKSGDKRRFSVNQSHTLVGSANGRS